MRYCRSTISIFKKIRTELSYRHDGSGPDYFFCGDHEGGLRAGDRAGHRYHDPVSCGARGQRGGRGDRQGTDPILEETLQDYDNVTVINDDILKVDINRLVEEKNGGRPIKVVANLPYYITTPIIMGLFESRVPLKSITIMVQKEVADRMQVGPGTKDYGALSLAVQYYAKPEIVANVPPNCFIPRPNVGSAVIRLTRYEEPPVQVKDEKKMFALIRASFNQRRKTLVNGLGNAGLPGITKESAAAALAQMSLSPTVRGEALTLEQFARLSDLL